MMIFECKDNGAPIMINPDHIVMIDDLTDADGKHFSRIYMANGHRAFIDVEETMNQIYRAIRETEKSDKEHAIKELGRIVEQLSKINGAIRK